MKRYCNVFKRYEIFLMFANVNYNYVLKLRCNRVVPKKTARSLRQLTIILQPYISESCDF